MKRSTPRTCTMLIGAAALAFTSAPGIAKDTKKGNWKQEDARAYCANKEGSTFWASPDGANYGCGYKGGGGLMCDKDTGCLESDGQVDEGQEKLRTDSWGLAGLLGLIGLLGLAGGRRRPPDPIR